VCGHVVGGVVFEGVLIRVAYGMGIPSTWIRAGSMRVGWTGLVHADDLDDLDADPIPNDRHRGMVPRLRPRLTRLTC
jgi:hypothetical protein